MVDGCYGEEDFSRPDLRVDQDQILQALVLGHSVNHGMQVMQEPAGSPSIRYCVSNRVAVPSLKYLSGSIPSVYHHSATLWSTHRDNLALPRT